MSPPVFQRVLLAQNTRMHSHLAPFIGLPHRAGHGVAGLLNARLVRAAALVIG